MCRSKKVVRIKVETRSVSGSWEWSGRCPSWSTFPYEVVIDVATCRLGVLGVPTRRQEPALRPLPTPMVRRGVNKRDREAGSRCKLPRLLCPNHSKWLLSGLELMVKRARLTGSKLVTVNRT